MTGAQGLTRAGLDLWQVQLLGRWGSDAVRGYVSGAALGRSDTWARRAAGGHSDLDVETLKAELAAGLSKVESLRARYDGACAAAAS